MNDKKYNWLLYGIIATIFLTVLVQGYWNYKNYLLNKQYFMDQVQLSLDNSLDTYFADLAAENHLTLIENDSLTTPKNQQYIEADSIFFDLKKEIENIQKKDIKGFTQITDSFKGYNYWKKDNAISQVKVFRGKKASDSIKMLKGITSIFISIKNDTLNLERLTKLLKEELKRKQLDISFGLNHFKNDTIANHYNTANFKEKVLKTNSKSTFLKHNEKLEMLYSNSTLIILIQGLSSLLISFILIIAVIGCLFYLLKIIKSQKQLAEIKNDLISNITHEFKTPIATISAAIEGIKSFNIIDNKAKTQEYATMSSAQLVKLNTMVEKLLETATLDRESLELNKKSVNLNSLLNGLVTHYEIHSNEKTFINKIGSEPVVIIADSFHLENAINNILDNAVKYGGDEIIIELNNMGKEIEILISDNGNRLTKAHSQRLFEKFYRIPKGNTHDVKGYGIGLYYTKSIIENHGGTINLILKNQLTTFRMMLPNE